MKVIIKPSDIATKKYTAIFYDDNGNKIETTHFGFKGMSDYTQHKNENRKLNYIARHRARENWSNPRTAGALSRWILWNKPSLSASIADYKKKFNLS